nr:hypothetical protein [Enterococcus faecium]
MLFRSSETNTNSATSQAATTVVLEGEGPNQIAERTGVPVETILSLNEIGRASCRERV